MGQWHQRDLTPSVLFHLHMHSEAFQCCRINTEPNCFPAFKFPLQPATAAEAVAFIAFIWLLCLQQFALDFNRLRKCLRRLIIIKNHQVHPPKNLAASVRRPVSRTGKSMRIISADPSPMQMAPHMGLGSIPRMCEDFWLKLTAN